MCVCVCLCVATSDCDVVHPAVIRVYSTSSFLSGLWCVFFLHGTERYRFAGTGGGHSVAFPLRITCLSVCFVSQKYEDVHVCVRMCVVYECERV